MKTFTRISVAAILCLGSGAAMAQGVSSFNPVVTQGTAGGSAWPTVLWQGGVVNSSGNPIFVQLTTGAASIGTVTAVGASSNATSAVATSSTNLPSISFNYGYNGTTWDQLQVDGSKNLKINCITGCASGTQSNASSGVATSSLNLGSVGYGYGFNGTTWDQLQVDASKFLKVTNLTATPAGANIIGKVGIDQTTPGSTNAVEPIADSSASAGIAGTASGSAATTLTVKASAGNLYSVYATNLTTTAGYLEVFNSASLPVDGAVTPQDCVPLPASGVASIGGPTIPGFYSAGIYVAVSSSTTCFTKTTTGSLNAFIKAQAK